ncbi:MAG TPA: RdgB/HAM1 family non-canonical purine NTP pyrophosphatase [Steroidobacteraceae bacterium]|nr:RdgB/HAM1 family non-canonical purine NTP pyrophosphatase [Steroidobacteraceae bacterium]
MATPRRVVLATGNAGKLREFSALLAPLGLQVISQASLGIAPAEETGDTFEANALLKARHAAHAAGLPALADDSGIEVEALDGRPGVFSARYAGPAASDADNNALLLAELAAQPAGARRARYRCVIAFVRSGDDSAPLLARGSWEGHIATAPAGEGGFGYDPLFIPEGLQVTAAQLDPAAKNALSHRGQALAALLQLMR